jgi:hypothetical protein
MGIVGELVHVALMRSHPKLPSGDMNSEKFYTQNLTTFSPGAAGYLKVPIPHLGRFRPFPIQILERADPNIST